MKEKVTWEYRIEDTLDEYDYEKEYHTAKNVLKDAAIYIIWPKFQLIEEVEALLDKEYNFE